MKKHLLKISSLVAAGATLFYAASARAIDTVSQGLTNSGIGLIFPSGGLIITNQGALQFIVSIIKLLLMFAGAIAVLFVIIGGFWYITSAGNEEQAEKGRNTLVNAIIGIIIIVLSYTIINVIVRTVTNCTSGFGC